MKGSLWLPPLVGGILGLIASNVTVALEDAVAVPSGWNYSPGTALSVLTTVVGATVALTGFVVTVSVLVVQMSTSTFSPRYMRLWYRDGVLKATLAMLIGTFAYSYSLLRRINDSVPNLGVSIAGVLVAVTLVLFLAFLNRVVHRLRPVMVAALVAEAGRTSFRTLAELATARRSTGAREEFSALLDDTPSLTVTSGASGAVQAIHDTGMLDWATRHDAVLVLRHAIGDFVSSGAALIEVHGAQPDQPERAQRELAGLVALGRERTIEQDPAFALRVLVDIALRALSPAVNDPTTAVQVIDHLEDTLALIGRTPGLEGRWEYRDGDGRLRLVAPAQRFEDLLALGVTEIRRYGAGSIQVTRRLRAALTEIRESVLPEYAEAVDREIQHLETATAATFDVDLPTAALSDRQGIGGALPLRGTSN